MQGHGCPSCGELKSISQRFCMVDGVYKILCQSCSKNDIERQYSDNRYPFKADFYIKSLDLFIEFNGSWTHSDHWFDARSISDRRLLNKWKYGAKYSKFYDEAIKIWTINDFKKREIARKCKLNYVVFWNGDKNNYADQVYEWLNSSKLIRHDYL